jgi:hypothetical protein
MENEVSAAVGYDLVGYVDTIEEAEGICNDCKTFTDQDCWAIMVSAPEFIYQMVEYYEN